MARCLTRVTKEAAAKRALLVVIVVLLLVALYLLIHKPGIDCKKVDPAAERRGSGCVVPVRG